MLTDKIAYELASANARKTKKRGEFYGFKTGRGRKGICHQGDTH